MKQLDKMILWNYEINILISYTIKWDIKVILLQMFQRVY